MKKLTVIIALVLCLALLSTGCTALTKKVTFKEYYKDEVYEDPAPLLNKMEEIPALKGMNYLKAYSDLLVLEENIEDTSMYVFYSRKADNTIWKIEKSTIGQIRYFSVNGNTFILTSPSVAEENESAEELPMGTYTYALYHMDAALRNELFKEIFGASWEEVSPEMEYWSAEDLEGFAQYIFEFAGIDPLEYPAEEEVVVSEDEQDALPAYSLYNATGTLIASYTSEDSIDDVYNYSWDLLSFGGVIYRVAEDGTLSEVVSAPFFGDIPEIDYKSDSYYFSLGDDGEISVYDLSLNTVMYWELPRTEIEEFSFMPLGGNIIVQVFTPLLAFEDQYDVMLEENEEGKYDMDTYIINPKTGKVTSANVDFVILSTDAQYSAKEWDSQYAYIAKIENKRILNAQSKLEYVSLNKNTGKVEAILLSDLNGTATRLTESRFLYKTYNGDSYLMDKDGNNLGKINKLSNLASTSRNENYIVLDGKLYNYDLAEVYNFAEDELSVRTLMGHSVIFLNKDNVMTLYTKDGAQKTLPEDYLLYNSTNQIYILQCAEATEFDAYMGSTYEYLLFNEEGTQLGKISGSFNIHNVSSNKNEVIFYATTEDGNCYYKLSIAAE